MKGNFHAGREFANDDDLAIQATEWQLVSNARLSSATGEPPLIRLATETDKGGSLPPTATDYGLLALGFVSAEPLVAVSGNRYSVPVAHVGVPVTVRLHRERIWRGTAQIREEREQGRNAHNRLLR